MNELDVLLNFDEKHQLYLVYKKQIQHTVKNWSKNRPEDPLRVAEIQHYQVLTGQNFVEGIVYAWCNQNDKKPILQIYDGWTRFCAASQNMQMLFHVVSTPCETDIIQHFIALNSAVPVPSLYLSPPTIQSDSIKNAVVKFSEKYKTFMSSSKRPNKPHFNRDNFMEQLSQLELKNLTEEEILDLLEKANTAIKKNHEIERFPKKAVDGQLFLFADKRIIWQEYVSREMENKEKKHSWFSFL